MNKPLKYISLIAVLAAPVAIYAQDQAAQPNNTMQNGMAMPCPMMQGGKGQMMQWKPSGKQGQNNQGWMMMQTEDWQQMQSNMQQMQEQMRQMHQQMMSQ